MSRKGAIPKRKVVKDPIYKSDLVSRFINSLMLDGKKSLAENIFYKAMEIVSVKAAKSQAVDLSEVDLKKYSPEEKNLKISFLYFKKAIDNISPSIEVRSRRVGGATYQVPVEVSIQRRRALAIRWLINAARNRREKGMVQRLANEILAASNKEGGAFDMLERIIKMAKANQAYAHYRW